MKTCTRALYFAFSTILLSGPAAFASPAIAHEAQSREPTVTKQEAETLSKAAELAEKDVAAAVSFLHPLVKPSSSAALDFALATFYLQENDLEQAARSYRIALEKMPTFARARANLAQVLIQQEKLDEAVNELQLIVGEGVANPSTYTLLGYTFLLKGEAVPAETAYRQALLFKPGDTNAYIGLTKSLLQQERYRECISLIRNLLESRPTEDELWSVLANACIALGDLDRAITSLECARRLGVASSEGLATMGDLYLNREQPSEALAAYTQAFSVEKPSVARLLRAAEGLLMMDQPSEAAVLIEQALGIKEKHPNSFTPELVQKLRWLQARQAHLSGKIEDAVKEYELFLEENPLHADALLALGDIYRQRSEYEKALLAYERAARLPDAEVKAFVRQAQAEVDRGRYSRAVELLEQAQAKDPQRNVARYLDQVRHLIR